MPKDNKLPADSEPLPDIANLIKEGSGKADKPTALKYMLQPAMWSLIHHVLTMPGHPNHELDWKKVADCFNSIIKKEAGESAGQIKNLTASSCRKACLTVARTAFNDAKQALKRAQTAAEKQALQTKIQQAKAALARQGWTTRAAKRPSKSETKSGNETPPATESKPGQEATSAATQPESVASSVASELKPATGAGAKHESNPSVEAPASKPDANEKPDADLLGSEPQSKQAKKSKVDRYYVTGDSFPVKDKLKELGASWDKKEKQWWFGDEKLQVKGQAVVDQHTKESKGRKK